MPDFVQLEVSDAVATVRLDRPPMNALNAQVQEELRGAAASIEERGDVRAAVLYGGPRVFAAGADIKQMADMSYADMVARAPGLQSAFTAVAAIPKPVVAAINGFALGGGCELALCADRRVAASDAKLGQPEIRLGVIPGGGGTQRLARLVGPARAKDLVFTGRQLDASEALALGLVDEVVPADEVYEVARRWAAQFAEGPALALRAAKSAIDEGLGLDLATGLGIERREFTGLFATEDRGIGMNSFREKRQPRFVGR